MFYHIFTKTFGQLLRLFYFRAWTKNMKSIPRKGPAIIASNHLAVIDSIVLPIVVWRKIWFIGKKEYFQSDTLKHRLQKWFFTSVSVYPVDRAGGKAAEDALNVGRRCLEKGYLFGIYPEGTRSPDGRLYRGHVGVAKLALEKRVPVVPVAMIGSREAQTPGQGIPYPKRVGCVFGARLSFEKYYSVFDEAVLNGDGDKQHEIMREVTDEIMREIQRVSGQEYVDVYASKFKSNNSVPPSE
jgi:1-acyl-sn-glycerol-3-phosphate acyltransferase